MSGQKPAHDIATVDIEHYIQLEIVAFRWPSQLGDVPGPELVGTRRQQLWPLVVRVTQLVSALPEFSLLRKDSIHRPDGADVATIVEEGEKDLSWRLIDKLGHVSHLQEAVPVGLAESIGAWKSVTFRPTRFWTDAPIPGGTRQPQDSASSAQAELSTQFRHPLHHDFADGFWSFSSQSNKTFF